MCERMYSQLSLGNAVVIVLSDGCYDDDHSGIILKINVFKFVQYLERTRNTSLPVSRLYRVGTTMFAYSLGLKCLNF